MNADGMLLRFLVIFISFAFVANQRTTQVSDYTRDESTPTPWDWWRRSTPEAATYETTSSYDPWWWGRTSEGPTNNDDYSTTSYPWWWGRTSEDTTPDYRQTSSYPWWWGRSTEDDTRTPETSSSESWWRPSTDSSLPGTPETSSSESWWRPSTDSSLPAPGGCFRPSSCAELLLAGVRISGIYRIYPRQWLNARPFQVYCDMETDGGGWTVIQRRRQNWWHIDFKRNWEEYKTGFGNPSEEFWLGNDRLFVLTNQDNVGLRVEMEDWDGGVRTATYSHFSVGDKDNDYRTTVAGYKGDAGHSMPDNEIFVTQDKNDQSNCARDYKGGWWYSAGNCTGNINGVYYTSDRQVTFALDGVVWGNGFRGKSYSLRRTEMKLRPDYFLKCAPIQKK